MSSPDPATLTETEARDLLLAASLATAYQAWQFTREHLDQPGAAHIATGYACLDRAWQQIHGEPWQPTASQRHDPATPPSAHPVSPTD